MALFPRPRRGQAAGPLHLFRLLGLGCLAIGGQVGRPAWAQISVPALGDPASLGTSVTCTASLCTIAGGSQSSNGQNLFQRFLTFDTRNVSDVNGVAFDAQNSQNVFVGVLSSSGTYITLPISMSSGGLGQGRANLIWLSPGGISISGQGSFSGVSQLTLSTASSVKVGESSFDYAITTSSGVAALTDAPNTQPGGLLFNALSSPSLIDIGQGVSLSVDQSLLLDVGPGSISISAAQIEPLDADATTSIALRGGDLAISQASLTGASLSLEAQGSIDISNQSILSTSAGDLTISGGFGNSFPPNVAVAIRDSTISASGGDVTIQNSSADGNGLEGVRIERSTITASSGDNDADSIGGAVRVEAIGAGYFGAGRGGLVIADSTINAAFISLQAIGGDGDGQSSAFGEPIGIDLINSTLTATAIGIDGSGGSNVSRNSTGLRISGGEITAAAGGIDLQGRGGSLGSESSDPNEISPAFSASSAPGIVIRDAKISVVSTGSLAARGEAGSSIGNADGIRIENSTLTTEAGNISLVGIGGTSVDDWGDGIGLGRATIRTESGQVSLSGEGGSRGTSWGIYSFGGDTLIKSSGGGNTLSITGESGPQTNIGISFMGDIEGFESIALDARSGILSLKESTISTFPLGQASGSGAGGAITISGADIEISDSTLQTSGTSTGGTITIGNIGDESTETTNTTSIRNSRLIADPPAEGGVIDIYGQIIDIQGSTLNVLGGSGGSLSVGSAVAGDYSSSTTSLSIDGNTVVLAGSGASLSFGSTGSLTNNAQINPGSPSTDDGGGSASPAADPPASLPAPPISSEPAAPPPSSDPSPALPVAEASPPPPAPPIETPPAPTPPSEAAPTASAPEAPTPLERGLDDPALRLAVDQSLNQAPLSNDPQTSSQLQQAPAPLLGLASESAGNAGLAVELERSGASSSDISAAAGDPRAGQNPADPPASAGAEQDASQSGGGAAPEAPLSERPVSELGAAESRDSFEAGTAQAQQDTARQLGLTDAEQSAPPNIADIQKAMQEITRWMRSRQQTSQQSGQQPDSPPLAPPAAQPGVQGGSPIPPQVRPAYQASSLPPSGQPHRMPVGQAPLPLQGRSSSPLPDQPAGHSQRQSLGRRPMGLQTSPSPTGLSPASPSPTGSPSTGAPPADPLPAAAPPTGGLQALPLSTSQVPFSQVPFSRLRIGSTFASQASTRLAVTGQGSMPRSSASHTSATQSPAGQTPASQASGRPMPGRLRFTMQSATAHPSASPPSAVPSAATPATGDRSATMPAATRSLIARPCGGEVEPSCAS